MLSKTALCTGALAIAAACFTGGLVRAADAGADDAEVAKLIRQLGDEDYQVRNAATDALIARSVKILPLLVIELNKDHDFETVTRLKTVIEGLVARAIEAPLKKAELALANAEKEHQHAMKTLEDRRVEMREEIESGIALMDEEYELSYKRLVKDDEAAGNEAAEKRRKVREALKAFLKKLPEMKAEYAAQFDKIADEEARWRAQRSVLASRAAQLEQHRKGADFFKLKDSPHLEKGWSAETFPADERFELKVCLFTEKLPFLKAVERVAEAAHLKVDARKYPEELADKTVSVILKDADVRSAMDVLTRTVGVGWRADKETGTIEILRPSHGRFE